MRAAQVEKQEAKDDAIISTQPPAVVFSVYNYGFRFLPDELELLESVFAQNGGATPSQDHLHRIAAAMSASPVRLAEPPHPVREKQIKTWFENRRQKLRRQRDQAAGRSGPGSKRLRSKEEEGEEEEQFEGGAAAAEDASVMVAATALLEASVAVPTLQAKEQPQQPTVLAPVRGVPLLTGRAAESGMELSPAVASVLAAPAEVACAIDSGMGALLHAIRDEVARSTLSAHTKELLLLHLLHSWSVLRTVSEQDRTSGQ